MTADVQPFIDLLTGKAGWVSTAIAWVTAVTAASRYVVKWFSGRIQRALTERMVAAAESEDDLDDRDISRILGARWYRALSFGLDLVLSIKIPSHADFIRLLNQKPRNPS